MNEENDIPTLVLLRDGHFKPLSELIDDIIEHANDYYLGKTEYIAEALMISRNTLWRKGLRGSKHKALGTSRPNQQKHIKKEE